MNIRYPVCVIHCAFIMENKGTWLIAVFYFAVLLTFRFSLTV